MSDAIRQLAERVSLLEEELQKLKALLVQDKEPWWSKTAGTFKDDPGFAEFVRELRKNRRADKAAAIAAIEAEEAKERRKKNSAKRCDNPQRTLFSSQRNQ